MIAINSIVYMKGTTDDTKVNYNQPYKIIGHLYMENDNYYLTSCNVYRDRHKDMFPIMAVYNERLMITLEEAKEHYLTNYKYASNEEFKELFENIDMKRFEN